MGKRIPKKIEKKIEIQKGRFIGPQMISRSQTNIVRKSKALLRECFVAIEPNFAAISMNWLNRRAPSGPSGESNTAQSIQRRGRRASIASCSNMFEVDGKVSEVGYDYLARVPRTNAIIGVQPRNNPQESRNIDEPSTSGKSYGMQNSTVSSITGAIGEEETNDALHYSDYSDQDLYSEESDDSPVVESATLIHGENVGSVSSDPKAIESSAASALSEMNAGNSDVETANKNHVNEDHPMTLAAETATLIHGENVGSVSSDPKAIEPSAASALSETNAGNSDVEMTSRTLEQPLQFDPFLRARNVPFRIANRRRSISVFSTLQPMETIHETEK